MSDRILRRRCAAFAATLATLTLAVGTAAGPAGAAPEGGLDYVAIGDSYTAGTGAGEADQPDEPTCWQSTPGYVGDVDKTGRVSLVDNAACHGALLLSGDDPLQQKISVEAQLAGLVAEDHLGASTQLVTITAGANDAGVSPVLFACATNGVEVCANAVAASEGSLGQVGAGLASAYATIHALAPNAKIAVLGYPRLFEPADGNPYFSADEQVLINRATDSLNTAIAGAVASAKAGGADAQFVDVTTRFAGHAVNSDDPWIAYDSGNPLADTNFHPNPTGHRAYATAVMTEVQPAKLAR
ncbi:SGNH/GDSL hydrolase family protein [Arthrobacter sp. B10-11]|uniref:SGNH/GDSL hydrolase family protein n=1 Tax=Arthrobacter sp. B10-11 TaxID=3081160 RepID=UPI002953B9AC|nr:SGNH/GDSL hydrolase family protein [Arthrobacter sp. B10-11]MDV8147051.1 SGNH/GDSL hydrolase family protein [Arthrobacter sp. B10-11]